MKKQFVLISIVFVVAGIPISAAENSTAQDWNSVDGVTPQSSERVDQINTYKKKQRNTEIKELQKGWEQEGSTVQSDERIERLNKIEKKRREQEIREIKCTMCTMRCRIVSDAGKSTCGDSEAPSETPTCSAKAKDFLDRCLQQCETC